jgi:hypothetical protein
LKEIVASAEIREALVGQLKFPATKASSMSP